MAGFAGGFNRLKMTILVTGLAGDLPMDVVELESGIHIMLEEQVVSCPAGRAVTLLTL